MYRVQITQDCFHLVRYKISGKTLCGELISGRTIKLSGLAPICEKCAVIFRNHSLATVAPKVRILPQTNGAFRELSNKTATITCMTRDGDHWIVGVLTDSARANLADECGWEESELEVISGDLDWYGWVRARLDQIPAKPDRPGAR